MNTDLENRMEDFLKNGKELNPCRNCLNWEFVDAEDVKYGYCLLGGGEQCDREDWNDRIYNQGIYRRRV